MVTKALSERKIEEGQKQKKVLEDIQRAEEGERKRNGVKFIPKVTYFSHPYYPPLRSYCLKHLFIEMTICANITSEKPVIPGSGVVVCANSVTILDVLALRSVSQCEWTRPLPVQSRFAEKKQKTGKSYHELDHQ